MARYLYLYLNPEPGEARFNNAVARTAGLIAIAVFGVIFVGWFNADLDQRMAAHAVPVKRGR